VRDVIDAMVVVRAFRALRRRPDSIASAIGTALLVYIAISLATPWSTSLQRRLMAAHHLEPVSMPSFAVLQLAPKMYGFSHRVWIGSFPLFARPGPAADARFAHEHFWVNHYPARMARFDGRRAEVFPTPSAVRFVYIRSRYRQLDDAAGYVVRVRDGQLLMQRLEGFR
jgi:hypothetical protein